MPRLSATPKPGFTQPLWLTILRVALGIILIWKGFNFIRDTAELNAMIEQTGIGVFSERSEIFALVVSILTLLCGFFITVGLFTRLSSVVQIPIVILAIIFVNSKNLERNSFELILTIVVLALLILFAIKGSGLVSADEFFRRETDSDRGRSVTF